MPSDVFVLAEAPETQSNGTLQFTGVPKVSNPGWSQPHQDFGTWIDFGYLFRHNDDRAMNLQFFDGHAEIVADWERSEMPRNNWSYWTQDY